MCLGFGFQAVQYQWGCTPFNFHTVLGTENQCRYHWYPVAKSDNQWRIYHWKEVEFTDFYWKQHWLLVNWSLIIVAFTSHGVILSESYTGNSIGVKLHFLIPWPILCSAFITSVQVRSRQVASNQSWVATSSYYCVSTMEAIPHCPSRLLDVQPLLSHPWRGWGTSGSSSTDDRAASPRPRTAQSLTTQQR